MGKSYKKFNQHPFVPGELYCFRSIKNHGPKAEVLWGLYDKTQGGTIRLESSTQDFYRFRTACPLPSRFALVRRATRCELRDYMYNLGCFEAKIIQTNSNPDYL